MANSSVVSENSITASGNFVEEITNLSVVSGNSIGGSEITASLNYRKGIAKRKP
jgi:hypothetical protein